MIIQVFIENEAGSSIKNIYNEKTFEFQKSITVSKPYPYPYGFITGTDSPDGDNLDCFVITSTILKTGQIIKCVPIGLMEQTEDGLEDHNVLAVPLGESIQITSEIKQKLIDFVLHVFDNIKEKKISAGEFLSYKDAEIYINSKLE